MKTFINYSIFLLTCLLTLSLPSLYLDYEIFYLNILGLSYLTFYIFFISKNSLLDLVATALFLTLGLVFDSILSNNTFYFYFYGLVDYPFFTVPPTWAAVLWLIAPLQFYNLKIKFKYAPAALCHVLVLLLLQRRDFVFIQEPFEENLLFTFVAWFFLYRILFGSMDKIKKGAFLKRLSQET